MSGDIAIYVQERYAKKAYKKESYNVRLWPGLELIKDVLVRDGFEVGYCGIKTVTDYKIILMSITHSLDWYTFIKERLKWREGKYTVIVGGPGILNIRPVLRWADIFVFGRGENLIIPLIKKTLGGSQYISDYIAYSSDFKPSKIYRIAQAKRLYPHAVTLANKSLYEEKTVGCQRACLFCSYCWHRKHIGGKQHEAGAMDAVHTTSTEITFFDLDLEADNIWAEKIKAGFRIIGLDGLSERLRFMVNKLITDKMVLKFYQKAHKVKGGKVKLYNIVGLPTENEEDLKKAVGLMFEADKIAEVVKDSGHQGFWIHHTPFRAMPATPAALWPMAYGL